MSPRRTADAHWRTEPGPAERALRQEYGPGRSRGLRLYVFVYGRVRQVCAGRPPAAAGHARWDEGAWADVTHEAFARYLIGGGQLEYAFTHATSKDHFLHLIDKQIRRTLDAMGPVSLASNVAARSVLVLVKDPSYEHVDLAGKPGRFRRFRLRGADVPLRMPTEAERLAVATTALSIPRTALAGPGARVHTYTGHELALFLKTVAHALPMSFTRADIKWIAERVFEAAGEAFVVEPPAWGRRDEDDDTPDPLAEVRDRDPEPSVVYEAQCVVRDIERSLTWRQLSVLAGRVAGLSNAEIARRLGCGPKVVARALAEARTSVDHLLQSELSDLSPWTPGGPEAAAVVARDLLDIELRDFVPREREGLSRISASRPRHRPGVHAR